MSNKKTSTVVHKIKIKGEVAQIFSLAKFPFELILILIFCLELYIKFSHIVQMFEFLCNIFCGITFLDHREASAVTLVSKFYK